MKKASVASDPSVQDRLSQLAAFGSRLSDPQASFGRWRGGNAVEGEENVITSPWFEHSDLANQLSGMLDRSGWVLQNFDWIRWARTREGKALLSDRGAIAAADIDQLAKLLTALVRGERFGEGTLAAAFGDGLLLAAAERAGRLLQEL